MVEVMEVTFPPRSSTNLDHPSQPRGRQPAKQYTHPFSCDRATASTPDGTT